MSDMPSDAASGPPTAEKRQSAETSPDFPEVSRIMSRLSGNGQRGLEP